MDFNETLINKLVEGTSIEDAFHVARKKVSQDHGR